VLLAGSKSLPSLLHISVIPSPMPIRITPEHLQFMSPITVYLFNITFSFSLHSISAMIFK
jgi:hypothetical protein